VRGASLLASNWTYELTDYVQNPKSPDFTFVGNSTWYSLSIEMCKIWLGLSNGGEEWQ
jgi:hypothetical protein